MSQEFKREERYFVIKISDLHALGGKTPDGRSEAELALVTHLHSWKVPTRESIVVESDWPEYEAVWKMIERRMSGQPPVTAAKELQAVLHWRDKHAQAVKERDALQQHLNTADQRVDELERKAKLYDQLQRGAELLPQGWMITVEIEREGGGVTLIDPQGNDLDYPSNHESMGDEVEDAIEEALAQQVAL